jgi:4-hydroxy-3-polyprenylbenzoate decarboxylase
MQISHALWGVGQMSFVKHAIFVNSDAPELRDYENITKYILDRLDFENIFISKGVIDALDHSSQKALVGGKIGIDVTGKVVSNNIMLIEDKKLLETAKILDSDILDLKQYFTNTPNPITVIKIKKTKPAKEIFDKLKSLKEHLRIVVFVDENQNDVNNPYMLVWRVTNNIDANRDVWIDDILGIDGTNKSEIDGFKREWPKDVNSTKEVIEDLRSRGIIEISDEEIEYYQVY